MQDNSQQPTNKDGEPIIDRKNGGDVVLQIMPEDMPIVSNPECKHEKLMYDTSESEYDTFRCKTCPMVWVYPKGSFVLKLK